MNQLFTAVVFSVGLTSPMLLASSLTLPSTADIIAVNGQPIKAENTLDLAEGVNQLALRYTGSYRDRGSMERFESEVVIVRFNAENTSYQLVLPNISQAKQASRFNQQPEIVINSASGPIAIQTDVLIKNGLQLGRNYQQELAAYNQTQQGAAVSQFASAYAVAVPVAPVSIAPPQGVTTAATVAPVSLVPPSPIATSKSVVEPKTIEQDQAEIREMLDYWYSKANENTKAEFKQSIN